jgi:hypothetical protein
MTMRQKLRARVLDKQETVQNLCSVTDLKVVAFEKLTTGIQLVITKFNELSWGWVSDSGGIRTSGLPFQNDRSKQANDTTHPPTVASYDINSVS